MTTEIAAPAATLTESAPVEPQPPATLPELSTLSPEQRQTWRETGNLPKPSDSAPDKAKTAAPDSAPEAKEKKPADSASDPAPDKDTQKPRQKTKEDTERRFKEITEENKTLRTRLEALEHAKTTPPRESKQESQPAAEVYKPLDDKEFFKANAKATYEDWVRAAAKHEAKWEARQEIALEHQRRAQAEALKELTGKVEEAKTRYPDFDQRVMPAVDQLMADQQIPFPVKAVMNDSPVFVDLMYVLTEPAALQDLLATAKANPAAAIRKIVLTEQLVQAELAKAKSAPPADGQEKAAPGDGKQRDASGKFVKSSASSEVEDPAAAEPITRAPHKTPVEIGGRQSAPEDEALAAVKANDYRSATRAFERDYAARHK